MVDGGPQRPRKANRRHPDEPPLRVWLGHVDVWDEQAALRALSPEERRRHGRLRRAEDRKSFAVSHAALRLVLADLLGSAPDEVDIRSGRCARCGQPHGKPEVSSGELEFNLTHSGQMFGVVVHPRRRVGIDLQEVTGTPSVDLARRFFTPAEHDLLRRLPPADQPAAFASLWSRKEAVLKADGRGIANGLADFAVLDGGTTEVMLPGGDVYTAADLSAPDGYAGAIAAQGAGIAAIVHDGWVVGAG